MPQTRAKPVPASRPNILLVLADQHRGDWQVHRGADFMRTPNLARLADEGARFDAAICASPLCVPSRICMATARDYGRAPVAEPPLRDNADWLPPTAANFYQGLRSAGYAVGACGKSDLRKPLRSWGTDGQHAVNGRSEWQALGFSHGRDSAGKHDAIGAWRDGIDEPYFAFLRGHGLAETHAADFARRPYPNYANCDPTPLPDFAYADNYVGAQALDLLSAFPTDAPWFLQVNFMGPHEPMDITAAMLERSIEPPLPDRPLDDRFDAGTHRAIRRNYLAMIENIDAWVGRFLAALATSGQLDDTVVIYASDHGEMLGEHREWTKWVPYAPSLGVPLIVWGKGIDARADRAAASIIDLGPTVLELAGADPLPEADGRSLLPRLAGLAAEGEVRMAGLGCWRAATDGRFCLIVGYRDGMSHAEMLAAPWSGTCDAPLLFDHHEDPGETRNLAADHPEIVARLFAHLASSPERHR